MALVLPKKTSVIFTGIVLLLTGLFSSWLIIEIVLFVCALGFCIYGVIWPSKELKESAVYFGYFWGMLLGLLAYPVWQLSGIMQIIPSLLGQ
jgi:hypothetical protein